MKNKFLEIIIISLAFSLLFPTANSQTITGIEIFKGAGLAYEQIMRPNPTSITSIEPIVSKNTFNKKVLYYINKMRRDPKSFYKKYLDDYIKEKSSRFTARYTNSLKKAMFHAPSLPIFQTDPILVKTATLQLNYLARFDGHKLTHRQGNIGFAERMKRSGLHCLAENLYATDDPKALEVVLDLLIDQNIPSFGHRKNLMNPLFTHIGVVSATPPGGRTLVIMDFGCKK